MSLYPQSSAFVLLVRCLVSVSLAGSYFIPLDQISAITSASRASSSVPSPLPYLAVSLSTLCPCRLASQILSASKSRVRCEGDLQVPSLVHRLVRVSVFVDFGPGAVGLRNTGPAPEAPPAGAPTGEEAVSEAPISVLVHSSAAIGAPRRVRHFVDS